MSDQDLERLEQWAKAELRLKERARIRLEAVEVDSVCFPLVGFVSEVDSFEFEPGIVLQRIEEPPTDAAMREAFGDPFYVAIASRYVRSIQHELRVSTKVDADTTDIKEAVARFRLILTCVKLASGADFLMPFALPGPWDTMAAHTDRSRWLLPLEDFPQSILANVTNAITSEHLAWAAQHFRRLWALANERRFGFALEAFLEHGHTADIRMALATLWSGIEALFDVHHELSFRIAIAAASFLMPRGEGRREKYLQIRKMYEVRSSVVHGSRAKAITQAELMEARTLLADLLRAMVELGAIPSTEALERNIFL